MAGGGAGADHGLVNVEAVQTDPPACRYLVVDDHAAFRAMLSAHLPGAGRLVTECGDGATALRLYVESKPDWVLMDVEMPGMDGLEATRELLRHHPSARVVIVSQHDSLEMEQAACRAGAFGFLPKTDLARLPALLQILDEIDRLPQSEW